MSKQKCDKCGHWIVQRGDTYYADDILCECSGAAPCSGELTNEQFIKLYNYVNDPKNGWINLGSNQQNGES
jgi:hypothetical protein